MVFEAAYQFGLHIWRKQAGIDRELAARRRRTPTNLIIFAFAQHECLRLISDCLEFFRVHKLLEVLKLGWNNWWHLGTIFPGCLAPATCS